jgi:putative sterol carrier protein
VLENVLRHFLAACEDDAALKAFAQTHTLSAHYTLSDAALEFFMSFALGEVQAGLGPPLAPAAVRLKLSAELLDGLMTGKINGMNAVMAGRIAFSGDPDKGMLLTQVQAAFNRLYAQAREAVGASGSTTASAGPTAPPPPPKPVPASAEVSASPWGRRLQALADAAANDAALCSFAGGHTLSLCYALREPELGLYLLFDQGRVTGGVGALPGADVTLAMSAATFDAIYTGRLDAAQAALSGALAFTGRARQALRAQTILPDLARLYGQGQRGMG